MQSTAIPPGPLLIQLPNWLGDAVVATGLVATLARAFPERDIDLFGNPVSLTVMAGEPAARRLLPPGGAGRGLGARLRAATPLRRTPYAASITLPPSWSAALLARVVGAPIRIGFAGAGRRACFNRTVQRPPRGRMHLLEEYARLAVALRPDCDAARPRVAVTAGERERALRLTGGGAYLAVAPGAIYGPAKRWGVEQFATAARQLVARRGWRVVLVGGVGDRLVCGGVASLLGTVALELSGRTSIRQLAAVLAGAELVLANDSGPMHLAAAVGTPVVGVFGSTEPVWTAPVGGAVARLQPPPGCAPCFGRTCDLGYICLTELAPRAVVEVAERLLEDRQERTADGNEVDG